jgi:molybdopterin-guanine dinucleotide biosynthesis adapter protein
MLGNGLALATWGAGELPGVRKAASVANWPLAESRAFALPGLDCGACGRDSCLELARRSWPARRSPACWPWTQSLSVRVGGQRLALNPFVDRLVTATIRGLLTELKGNVPGQKIEIILE